VERRVLLWFGGALRRSWPRCWCLGIGSEVVIGSSQRLDAILDVDNYLREHPRTLRLAHEFARGSVHFSGTSTRRTTMRW